MRAEELAELAIRGQINELRDRYNKVFERRIDYLNNSGYFQTAEPDACDNPDYEMEALEDWLKELRFKVRDISRSHKRTLPKWNGK